MILEQLKKKEKFSDTEKEIADYILRSGEAVVHMTIREFSDASYSSPTAVMRLCRKLGCSGFKDFKVRLLKDLQTTETWTDVNRPFYIGYSTVRIARLIYDLNQQAAKGVLDSLDPKSLEKAAKAISHARLVFLYGFGDSSIRARNLMNRLFKINKMCILATESNEEAGISYNATANDAAIFISYRGGTQKFVDCARTLKANHCPIITLTADVRTTLTDLADIRLTIPDREHAADNIGTFYSQAAFDYLLNVLYSLVYSMSYQANADHKKKIDGTTVMK